MRSPWRKVDFAKALAIDSLLTSRVLHEISRGEMRNFAFLMGEHLFV
jgi:hypothetical protein